MWEIRKSGSMSGEGERSDATWPKPPRPSSTLLHPLAQSERRWFTTLRENLVKIGAKVVRHGRYVTFQLAEVAVPKELFRKILSLIDDLRRRPVPA